MKSPTYITQLVDIYPKEWLLSFAGWSLFFIYSILYCTFFYSVYVDTTHPGLLNSVLWFFTEYGCWVPVTPFLFRWLSAIYQHSIWYTLVVSLVAAAVMTSLRVGLDAYLNPAALMPSNIVYFVPTHLTIAAVIFLSWFALLSKSTRPYTNQSSPYSKEEQQPDQSSVLEGPPLTPTAVDIIEVQKGNINKLLPVSDIDSVNAAGNYMEVVAGAEVYLTRCTLSELEKQLPQNQFVRIHRSYLINTHSVVNVTPKGNVYHVTLKNQQCLPLSKKRKPVLDKQLLSLR